MKKSLVIALTALGIVFSSLALADRDRGYRDGYGHHGRGYGDRHYRAERHHRGHWKGHRVYAAPRYYRPYYPQHHVVHHYHDDDLFVLMGGVYLLNEVLHHDRH